MKQVNIGLNSYGKAISFILKNNLGWYFLFPLALNIAVFYGGLSLTDAAIDFTQENLLSYLEGYKESWYGDMLGGAIAIVVWVIIRILFFFVFAYFGGYIVQFCLAPVFAMLSQKVEEKLTGIKDPFNADQVVRDMFRGMLLASRNFLIEVAFIVLFFFLSFVPVIGWLSPVALFIVSAYFYGFSFIDYWNERKKLTISQSVKYIRKNKLFACTNGSIYALVLLIPFCGMSLAGFISIISVVAASLGAYQIDTGETYNPKQIKWKK